MSERFNAFLLQMYRSKSDEKVSGSATLAQIMTFWRFREMAYLARDDAVIVRSGRPYNLKKKVFLTTTEQRDYQIVSDMLFMSNDRTGMAS